MEKWKILKILVYHAISGIDSGIGIYHNLKLFNNQQAIQKDIWVDASVLAMHN